MAGTVKSVSVIYQAFTDKFERKTKKAGDSLGGFAKKALAFGAGFIAARATLGKFTQQMEKLDRLGKLSDALEIDPNTLRGLDLAATQTGTSFEIITKGVQRLTRTIGEAKLGMSSGTLALKELGLAAEDFDGLNVEQSFLKAADAVAAIKDPTARAATAFRFFGRSGTELLNVLQLGSKGIRDFVKEAERIGGPISRQDIADVEAANDAIDKMGRAFDGIINKLVIKFAPIIESISDSMQEMSVIADEIGAAWSNTARFVDQVVLALNGLEDDPFVQKGTASELASDLIQRAKEAAAAVQGATGGLAATGVLQTRFSQAAVGGGSAAFDILNQGGGIQDQQLKQLEMINKGVAETNRRNRGNGVKFVEVSI